VLQAVAYALAGPSDTGIGRYVYLAPEIGDAPPECRTLEAAASDQNLRSAFWEAVSAIEGGMEEGVAFPRVQEADGRKAEHCRFCQVSEGCRWDDSKFRERLVELLEVEGAIDDPALAAARRLWWLGVETDVES
jgi:hypothetical protein